MRLVTGVALLVGVQLALGSDANAVNFRIQSETVGDAYQLVTSANEMLNRRRLHQLLGFGAYDLLGDGEYKLNLTTMFRFDADLGITDDELDRIDQLDQTALSIQYAYVEGRDIGGFLGFRAGRQLHADTLDYLMFDGVLMTFETPWHIGVEVLAGLEVKQDQFALNRTQFESDGVRFLGDTQDLNAVTNEGPTIAVGAALMTTDLWNTRVKVSYRRLFTGSNVDSEKLGGSVYQRAFEVLHLHATANYDFYNERFERIEAGARWQITDAWDIEAQYLRMLPSFDSDSIFNVFSVFPMNDLSGTLAFHPSATDRAYIGGMVRLFGNEGYVPDDPSNPTNGFLSGDVDTVVEATGIMAGYRGRFGDHVRASFDMSLEGGYGGRRALFDLGASWEIVPGEWSVDGRFTTLLFDDELQANLNAVSVGYQLGGSYRVGELLGVALMAEQNFNRLQTQSFRFFAVVDVNVWL